MRERMRSMSRSVGSQCSILLALIAWSGQSQTNTKEQAKQSKTSMLQLKQQLTNHCIANTY